MPTNRLTSIVLIFALMALWSGPLAGSFSEGSADGGEAHYCEVSKGPCRHGDACPIKHGHHAAKPADQHEGDEEAAHHGHHGPAAKTGKTAATTAFSCHGSAHASNGWTAPSVVTFRAPLSTVIIMAVALEPPAPAIKSFYTDTDRTPRLQPPQTV